MFRIGKIDKLKNHMIALSEIEKDFLKSIVDLNKRTYNMFLSNFVDKYLNNIEVVFDYDNNSIEYRFDALMFTDFDDLVARVREVSWTFLKLVKLLKYLEQKNYLHLYKETNEQISTKFGKLPEGNKFISQPLLDPETKNILFECSQKTIIIGQTLIDFVNKGFKTIEQLQHEDNIRIADANLSIAKISLKKGLARSTFAISISIVLGLISVGSSFYIANKQNKHEILIDSKQINAITNRIDSINSCMRNLHWRKITFPASENQIK